jgi:hypothetical protein
LRLGLPCGSCLACSSMGGTGRAPALAA